MKWKGKVNFESTPQVNGVQVATDDTVSEHYQQHSGAIQTILKELDGYTGADPGLTQTVDEHYDQHSEAIQTILKELDGYAAGEESGDLAIALARRTTTLNYSTSYTDITFDTTDEETDTAVVDHLAITDRIQVKEDGLYEIGYFIDSEESVKSASTTYTIDIRVRINDSTVIPASEGVYGNEFGATAGADEPGIVSKVFPVTLEADGYLTVQARYTEYEGTATPVSVKDPIFWVKRLSGAKGSVGLTGSGSNVLIKDEDGYITATPHSVINFTGSGVTATDAGNGQVDVTISGVFGSEFDESSSEGENSTTSDTFQEKLTLATGVVPAGKYRIGWYCEWQGQDKAGDGQKIQIQIDDTTTIGEINGTWDNMGANSEWLSFDGFYYATLTNASHDIDLDYASKTSGKTAKIRKARLEIWRIS